MTIRLQPFESAMLPAVHRALLRSHAPQLTEETWRRVFDRPARPDHEPPGYVLLDEGEPVGILGTLFSERVVDGVLHRFCNLHTWVVRDEHRGRALTMMRPILRLTDHTVTDFTPSAPVYKVSRKLGFMDLDQHAHVLLPPSGSGRDEAKLRVIDDQDEIERAGEPVTTISRDHRDAGCGQLLIADDGGVCHLVYTVVRMSLLRYCYLHYIGERAVFERNHRAARRALLDAAGASLVVVDARLMAGIEPGAGFDFPLKVRKLYRSRLLAPAQIDNLYSEQILMNLSGFTNASLGITRTLRELARRWRRRS